MTDRSPLLDLYELRSGPEPRARNHVADFLRDRGLMGLSDRFNDPRSGAGMIADALGDVYTGARDAVTAPARVFRGEIDPRSNEGITEALNLAGNVMGAGVTVPRPSSSVGAFGNPKLFPRHYYPNNGLTPLHDVTDWSYARKIARAAINGDTITPILYEGLPNNGNLLAGTHRSAANEILEFMGHRNKIIEKVEINDVLNDPLSYGLTKSDAQQLRNAIQDGDYELIDKIWDRR